MRKITLRVTVAILVSWLYVAGTFASNQFGAEGLLLHRYRKELGCNHQYPDDRFICLSRRNG